MGKPTYTEGDKLYLVDGSIVRLVGMFGEKYIVAPVLEDDFDPDEDAEDEPDEEYGQSVLVDAVYAKPPTGKLASEVAELDKAIEAKTEELRKLERTIWEADQGREAARKRIGQHILIDRLDEWLAGKSLWFVCEQWGRVRLAELDRESSALYLKSDYHSVTKPTWVFEVAHSSHRATVAWATQDEARTEAHALILSMLADKKNEGQIEALVTSAANLGLELDPAYSERVKAARLKAASEELAKAEAAANKARAAYEAATK